MASKKRRKRGQPEPLEVCRGISDLYLLLVFGIFPLAVGTGDYGYANLVETKTWLWFGLTALWLSGIAGYLIWCRVKKLPVPIRLGWVHGAALAFLGVSIVSAALSGYPRASFLLISASNTNSAAVMASYAAAFAGISHFGRLRKEHIRALGVSTLLSGLLSEIQLAGYNPLTMYPKGLNYYNKHKEYAFAFLGTMGNVDILAAFLCFAVPILIVYAVRSAKRQDRFLLVPAFLSLHILYRIDVDAAKSGLAGCLVLSLPVILRDRRRAKHAAAAGAAAVILGLAAVYFWPGERGFLSEASQILHGHIEPSFGHDRVEIWMKAWEFIRKKPVLGNGPCSGSWLLGIQKMNREWNRVNVVGNTHNTYLGYLMDMGFLGLGCYLALIAKGIFAWFRNRRCDLAAALGAGLAGYFLQDFFSVNLAVTAPFFWIGLGLLAGGGFHVGS